MRLLGVLLALGCRRTPSASLPAPPHDAGPTLGVDTGPPPPPREDPPLPSLPQRFRLDARHTGRSGFVLPRDPRVVARIVSEHRISAQAVALDEGTVVFGSHDGVVYAGGLDGTVRWRANLLDRVYTTPLVTPTALYVGTDADRMVSLSPRGRVQVALATDDDADTSANIGADGAIYFAAGRTLYRVDADMTVRWRVAFGGKVYSAPAIMDDGTVVVGCQDDHLYAVTPDGRIRWQLVAGGDIDATPAIAHDGTIYVGSDDGHVYAVTTDGTLRWRTTVGGYVRAGAGLTLDHGVVVSTYGPRPSIVCLDATAGTVRWRVSVSGPPSADYGVASAPLIDAEGAIAVGTPDDTLLFLEEDGRVRTRLSMPADVDGAPVLMRDGLLVVGCDDGAMTVVGTPSDLRDAGDGA